MEGVHAVEVRVGVDKTGTKVPALPASMTSVWPDGDIFASSSIVVI